LACHQVGPGAKTVVGPELNGVVGRKAGSAPGFDYSPGLKNSGITWTKPELEKWLAGPQQMISGTKMIFPGLPDAQSRDNVIAYLATLGPDGQTTGAK
ncbi:MAG: c-type cytochrome, partial [Pseudomonadota bacterium]|nr:c-type cytochrome [Pseudomonadota bacterium]